MTILRGRVIDLANDAQVQIALAVEGSLRLVSATAAQIAGLAIGDLVAIETNDGTTALDVQRHGGSSPGTWDPSGDALRWRRLGVVPARLETLRLRHEVIRAIRDDLCDHGFLEVQTPLLVRGTCPDPYIDSIRVGEEYLVTSTEYQIKRLIVGGCEKLFTLTQNFRQGDEGVHHNPEFTMLEWARAWNTLEAIEADAERFVVRALDRIQPGVAAIRYDGRLVELRRPWERLTVREALFRHLRVELDEDFSLTSMLEGAQKADLELPDLIRDDALDCFSYLLTLLQPELGTPVPTFLREWPSFMTSSAALSSTRPNVAERSELFIAGMEIADGFPSLQNAEEQRKAFERAQIRRRASGKEQVDLDESYIKALELGIPPGAGMALGIDRLVMILTGRTSIRDVLPFAWDER